MGLPVDPRLPNTTGPGWPVRLVQRLTELLREWSAVLNPWIGPSWEDLRFPAQGINPPGPTNTPTIDTTAYPGTLLFAGNAVNLIGGVAQMPHSWREGRPIRPHIHWRKTVASPAAQGVLWEFAYARSPISATAEAWSSWTTGTLVAGDLTAAEMHNLSTFGEITMVGLRGSDMVHWQVRRDGVTDSETAVCRLLEFDLHYEIGQVGSSNKKEFPD
jgi:hypothetical protein